MYHDAYTLQKVEPEHLASFNFAAGMVPFLLNLIQDVSPRAFLFYCISFSALTFLTAFAIMYVCCVFFFQ